MNGNGGYVADAGGFLPGTLDYFAAHGFWYPEGYTGTINPSSQGSSFYGSMSTGAILAAVIIYMAMAGK